jgi:hypothetical protein
MAIIAAVAAPHRHPRVMACRNRGLFPLRTIDQSDPSVEDTVKATRFRSSFRLKRSLLSVEGRRSEPLRAAELADGPDHST